MRLAYPFRLTLRWVLLFCSLNECNEVVKDVFYEVLGRAFAEEGYNAISCDPNHDSPFLHLEDDIPDLSVFKIVVVELGVSKA